MQRTRPFHLVFTHCRGHRLSQVLNILGKLWLLITFSCPQRQCVKDVKCKGHLTSGSLKQFTAGSLRECISSCSHHAVSQSKAYRQHHKERILKPPKLMPLRSASSTPFKTTPTSASSTKIATRTPRPMTTCPATAVRQERLPAA